MAELGPDAVVEFINTQVSYKPGWRFEASHIPDREVIRLVVQWTAADSRRPRRAVPLVSMHEIHTMLLEDQRAIENFVHFTVRKAEMHEVDEWLVIAGRAPFDPHGEKERSPERLGAKPDYELWDVFATTERQYWRGIPLRSVE